MISELVVFEALIVIETETTICRQVSLGDFGRMEQQQHHGMEGGVTNFVNLISAIAAADVVVTADNNLKPAALRALILVIELSSEQTRL